MFNLIRYLIGALLVLTILDASSAFHYHHFITAALLANSFKRPPFVPLPIPIPIPVKTGGNTIIAMAQDDDNYYDIPVGNIVCGKPPCHSGHSRRIDFW